MIVQFKNGQRKNYFAGPSESPFRVFEHLRCGVFPNSLDPARLPLKHLLITNAASN